MPTTTVLYAGLLGLLAIGIAAPAGRLRGQLNISVGDGGNPELLCAMRRHANFVEWAPLALLLIALLELNGTSTGAIHVLGATLVISRLLHAAGMRPQQMRTPGRFIGATGTMLVIAVSSVWLIVSYFRH